jgi:dephospho-CoA kinase
MFEALGAGVVDTDVISREFTAAGGGAMADIARDFGSEYVGADGSLDRARMRALVFADPQAKTRLEAILHPRIRATTRERIAQARAPYVLIVVPLLFETGAYRELIDRVLVVDCDEAQQVARVVARSGLAEDEVRRIMKAQLSRAERLARADDVLVNDGDINSLREHVEELHARYIAAAREKG